MLRILAGKWKNHPLKVPKSDQVRPTSSLVRKAFFDIVKDRIDEARFLDLYAGSGAMGFEALSRGASHATFVDLYTHSISENQAYLKASEQTVIYKMDVLKALKKLNSEKTRFDIIYIDPPYTRDAENILNLIDQSQLLEPGGMLCLEKRAEKTSTPFFEKLTALHLIRTKLFGSTILHFFVINEPIPLKMF